MVTYALVRNRMEKAGGSYIDRLYRLREKEGLAGRRFLFSFKFGFLSSFQLSRKREKRRVVTTRFSAESTFSLLSTRPSICSPRKKIQLWRGRVWGLNSVNSDFHFTYSVKVEVTPGSHPPCISWEN